MKCSNSLYRFGAALALAATVVASPAHATVILHTSIRALDLFGTGVNGPIELHLTPGMPSIGITVLALDGTPGDITPGNGQATVLSSFFDVFADLTSDPGTGPVTISVIERIAISAPCENPVGSPPVPPGCMYEAIFVVPIDGVMALFARHFVFLPSVVFITPLLGFDFAESFDTTIIIDPNPHPNRVMNGRMTVDARVPEPATFLLVLLGVAGATLTRRRSSR